MIRRIVHIKLVGLAILLVFVLAPATGSAAGPDRGILWRIVDSGRTAGHLLGTIHSDRPSVLALPEAVDLAFRTSTHFAFELDLRRIDQAKMTALMQLPRGQSLATLLPADLWQRARRVARGRGVPSSAAARLKPWALAILIVLPPTNSQRILDHHLQGMALRANKSVTGLETAEEQLSVFNQIDTQRQIEQLRRAVKQVETGRASNLYDDIVRAWLQRDLRQLASLANRYPALPDGRENDALSDRLLRQRNERMVERMQPLLDQGRAFIAVGAMHLVGEHGLVRMLERRGYTLQRAY